MVNKKTESKEIYVQSPERDLGGLLSEFRTVSRAFAHRNMFFSFFISSLSSFQLIVLCLRGFSNLYLISSIEEGSAPNT